MESLDLIGGPGGNARTPVAPFTFVEEASGGTAPKVIVKDARSVKWMVKFGPEVKSESFASRIVWAAGYFAEPTYFVPQGKIESVAKLGRSAKFVGETGAFTDARFQLLDEGLRGASRWSLTDSALKGSRELAGLKLLVVLLANWDVKTPNLSIVPVKGEPVYAITDWGATMGRPGELTGRSKWNCEEYAEDSKYFIDGVDNGFVTFNYQGKQGYEILRGIGLEDVRWLMGRLGKLSDAQIHSALRASGATADEIACFAPAFRSRIEQLISLTTPRETKTTTTRPVR